MKMMLKMGLIIYVLSLSACSNYSQSDQSSGNKKEDVGRAETKSIQAADALGHDGTEIRVKVDAALDANDQRKDGLDMQIDAQTGSSVPAED